MSRPPGRPRGSTKVEKLRHIRQVYAMLLKGLDPIDIIKAAEQLGWNFSNRTIETYIAEAHKRVEARAEPEETFDLGKAKARRDALYGRAWDDKDVRAALAVEHDLCELLGLYPAKRTELTGKEGGPIKHEYDFSHFSDEELERAILREAKSIAGGAPATEQPMEPTSTNNEAEAVS